MKNTIIAVLLLATIVAGYYAISTIRVPLEGLEGRMAKVIRGDLTVPINANGEVRPARRVEIKSEASGEVIEIAKHGGDRVAVGDLIIRLQKDDEQRNVDRAKLELDAAEANLETARIRLAQAETADLATAQAEVDRLMASVAFAEFRREKLADLPEDQRNAEEMFERLTTYRSQVAQLDRAKAALEVANLAIPQRQSRSLGSKTGR